ncbi:MAG: NUDIX hydrolase [Nitrospirota bacterium]
MEILDKKTVWQGTFLRTLIITYKDHSGAVRTWEAVERINCNGIAVIAPLTPAGELLLTRQFRVVVNEYVIEFPAGLNDKGENIAEAAQRELVEETGYTAESLIALGEGPISSGMSTEVLTAFWARNAVPASPAMRALYPPDPSEDIEIIKAPLERVYEILEDFQKKGDIVDLKVYGIIELLRREVARIRKSKV